MKHQATFTAISLKEQATIIGGEDKKPRPKTVTKKGDVTIGNGNKVIINIFTFDF